MNFSIRHILRYRYSQAVFLEPFTVRLQPRCDAFQHAQRFELTVDPAEAGRTAMVEHDGHVAAHLWFNGTHDHLTLTAQSQVQTMRDNPFDFILSSDAARLPLRYDAPLAAALAPYVHRDEPSAAIDALAAEVLHEANHVTTDFLSALTDRLYAMVRVDVREEGEPWPASQTLREQCGSCRDVAVLFMAACRSVGLAARFVSGYTGDASQDVRRQLHAWAEVYLPDAGWRGFDPSLGLAVASDHIVLAAAAHPTLAAPTTGHYRGTGAQSEFSFELDIESSA